jgi:hypothetical protein
MQRFAVVLLLFTFTFTFTCCTSVAAAFVSPHHDQQHTVTTNMGSRSSSMRRIVQVEHTKTNMKTKTISMNMVDKPNAEQEVNTNNEVEPPEEETADVQKQQQQSSSSSKNNSNNNNNKSDRYDVSKLVSNSNSNTDDGSGSGFNQFDPVLSATGFLSRRFGILGGLALFAALAAVEGGEILKSFDDSTPLVGNGETVTTSSGLQITELLIGKGGLSPLPGYIVGLQAVVKIGDKVIFDSTGADTSSSSTGSTTVGDSSNSKPIAFKYGQRPFQNVLCEGVEEGIKGMKVGGKRVLDVPSSLAPPGVVLPPGVPLIYEVELTEVLPGYF